MLSHKTLNQLKYHLRQKSMIGYMMLVVGMIMLGRYYCMWNVATNNMGPLVFMNTALSNQFKDQIQNNQKGWMQSCIKEWVEPFGVIKRVLPGIALSDVGGLYAQRTSERAFSIPQSEDIISLTEDNRYTPVFPTPKIKQIDKNKLNDPSYLLQYFITGDGRLNINSELLGLWDFKELSQKPIRIAEDAKGPQVLIFHTHVKERYAGESKSGEGVAAVGEELANILEKQYGIQTMQVKDSFYLKDSESVTGNYERMTPVIENILKENPSIEVVIDLHRDGIKGNAKFLGDYNGKPTAKFMFVNGICMSRNQAGDLVKMKELVNPYLEENLAFSIQSQIQGLQYYPDIMRKMYLKDYRYSLHMKPNSLLIEVGNQNNTLEEALNSAEPIAHIIAKVLEKD
ncbi:MAG: stage II sporulation protein P [Cellulosilyticaceae bacterium]